MSISFEELFVLMKKAGINKAYLRKHGIHANTVDRLIKNESVNTDIVDRLCRILDCQPGDFMKYSPDDKEL